MSCYYICDMCGKDFRHKGHYKRHILNTKKMCNANLKLDIEHPNKKCKYCNHLFSRNQNLIRHLKSCKNKISQECNNNNICNNNNSNNNDDNSNNSYNSDNSDNSDNSNNNNNNNNNSYDNNSHDNNSYDNNNNNNINYNICANEELKVTKKSLLNENKILKKKIDNDNVELKKKLENIENLILNNQLQNVNNTQNINIEKLINNNNNIFIINYKDSKIEDDDMKSILNNNDPILCAVEKIHCSKDAPLQHNILINDKTRNNIYVYENDNWILKDKSDTLKNIYGLAMKNITDKITNSDNKIEEIVNMDIQTKYKDTTTDNLVDEKKYFYKNPNNIKKHTKRLNDMFYSHKNMINETKRKNDILVNKKNRTNKINNINNDFNNQV